MQKSYETSPPISAKYSNPSQSELDLFSKVFANLQFIFLYPLGPFYVCKTSTGKYLNPSQSKVELFGGISRSDLDDNFQEVEFVW